MTTFFSWCSCEILTPLNDVVWRGNVSISSGNNIKKKRAIQKKIELKSKRRQSNTRCTAMLRTKGERFKNTWEGIR